MTRLIHLIDTLEYVRTNCFQHQLFEALAEHSVVTVKHHDLLSGKFVIEDDDFIVSCLKQRSLTRHLDETARALKDRPVNVYDQDPWVVLDSTSEYAGAYEKMEQKLNLNALCIPNSWWCDRVAQMGLPTRHVRMWVLPRYCTTTADAQERPIHVGFVGQVHSYRKKLIDELEAAGLKVTVFSGSNRGYADYLKLVGTMSFFVHSEDLPVKISDTETANLKDGMWHRDVEVMSQGTFSIRPRGMYPWRDMGFQNLLLSFDDPKEVPELIMSAERAQVSRQASVDAIRDADKWKETARRLVNFDDL